MGFLGKKKERKMGNVFGTNILKPGAYPPLSYEITCIRVFQIRIAKQQTTNSIQAPPQFTSQNILDGTMMALHYHMQCKL